jgi:hypothetical protein
MLEIVYDEGGVFGWTFSAYFDPALGPLIWKFLRDSGFSNPVGAFKLRPPCLGLSFSRGSRGAWWGSRCPTICRGFNVNFILSHERGQQHKSKHQVACILASFTLIREYSPLKSTTSSMHTKCHSSRSSSNVHDDVLGSYMVILYLHRRRRPGNIERMTTSFAADLNMTAD